MPTGDRLCCRTVTQKITDWLYPNKKVNKNIIKPSEQKEWSQSDLA